MTSTTLVYTTDPDRILAKASKLAEAMQASTARIERPGAPRSLRIQNNDAPSRRPSSSSSRAQKSPKSNTISFNDVSTIHESPQRSNTTTNSRTPQPTSSALGRSSTDPHADADKPHARPNLLRTITPDGWPLRRSSDSKKDSGDNHADPLPRLKPQDIVIPSAAHEYAITDASPLPSTPRLRESTDIPDSRKLKYAHPETGKFKAQRLPNTPPLRAPPAMDSLPAVPTIPSVLPAAPFMSASKEGAHGLFRDSVKSSATYVSSVNDVSGTERSSTLTAGTSTSDLFGSSLMVPRGFDEELTVEECIAMYEQGFEDDPLPQPPPAPSEINVPFIPNKPAISSPLGPKKDDATPVVPKTTIPSSPKKSIPELTKESSNGIGLKEMLELEPTEPNKSRARTPSASQTPSLLSSAGTTSDLLLSAKSFTPSNGRVTSTQIFAGDVLTSTPASDFSEPPPDPNADRYGFRKSNQYISLETYETWNADYRQHLHRRRQKWNDLMRQHSLNASHPTEFPPRSDKVKRFIRKGVPPEWRGAAWFWYAGGPARLAQNPGLYQSLVDRCGQYSQLGDGNRESIERDLYRTFPDNDKFKRSSNDPYTSRPGSVTPASTPSPASRASERPMITKLRRVLRAFAVHQPRIGYCQSLNFLAGLLLLSLNGDEERAFHLLCILTNEHLPGTHGFTLEGANVDIGVLMSTLKDKEPSLWVKLDDRADGVASPASPSKSNRLPTVSLATTSWFMSCFVGSLPIECCCRVWDVLFYEGSKTLFRVALGIFRLGADELRSIKDPMEILGTVQTLPRKMLDANALMSASFGRDLEGRGLLSQDTVKRRREERRTIYQKEHKERELALRDRAGSTSTTTTEATADAASVVESEDGRARRPSLSRGASLRQFTRWKSKKGRVPPVPSTPGGL